MDKTMYWIKVSHKRWSWILVEAKSYMDARRTADMVDDGYGFSDAEEEGGSKIVVIC